MWDRQVGRRASLSALCRASFLLCMAAGAQASDGGRVQAAPPQPRAANAAEPRLEWRAPAGCPGRDEVLEQVAALAANDEVDWARFEGIRGSVGPDGARWVLVLRFAGQAGLRQRVMNGAGCVELAQAAAVAIVLASRGQSSAGDWEAEPAPGEIADRAAEPVATAPPAGSPSAAGAGDAGEVGKASFVGSDSDGAALALALDVEALLDPATLGSVALGASAGMRLRFGAFSTGLYGVGLPSATTELAAGEAVAIGLWAGGLRGCHRWGRGLDACVLLELGQVAYEGVGLVGARKGQDLWVAPGLSVGFVSTPFDGFGISTRLSAFHPLIRGQFRVDEAEVVHRIPGIGFRLALGIDLPLL
jgi:hypothetical protein